MGTSRPFYFFLSLWGERFRNIFLEYCLPSLLAPGNIPALSGSRTAKFLIATLPEDWEAMSKTPIFGLLKRHAEPVFIEIPPCPPDRVGCQHIGIGHQLATEMAHRDGAYAVLLSPDLMLPDKTVAKLDAHARAGIDVVLVPALRYGEEPLFERLTQAGAIPGESRRDSGNPIVIPNRTMVAAALKSFHSESLSYAWDAPLTPMVPSAYWWDVPGEDGIVVHCFSWVPLLMDYQNVEDHDSTALETSTIDHDYVFKNFFNTRSIHVVQDSDEIFLASWAPLNDKPVDLTPSHAYVSRFVGEWTKGALLGKAYASNVFDPLKRELFLIPLRWHARALNAAWARVERRARRKLALYVKVPKRDIRDTFKLVGLDATGPRISPTVIPGFATVAYSMSMQLRHRAHSTLIQAISVLCNVLRSTVILVYTALMTARDLWVNRSVVIYRIGQVMVGNASARARVQWRMRGMIAQLLGRPYAVPEPKPRGEVKDALVERNGRSA